MGGDQIRGDGKASNCRVSGSQLFEGESGGGAEFWVSTTRAIMLARRCGCAFNRGATTCTPQAAPKLPAPNSMFVARCAHLFLREAPQQASDAVNWLCCPL